MSKLSIQTTLETSAKKKVKREAENALNYLIERREFWAQQNPDYPELTAEELEEDSSKSSWKLSAKKTMKRMKHETGQKSVETNPYG